MGSHAELTIGDIHIDSRKIGVDPVIMVLFCESEKQLKPYPPSSESEDALQEDDEDEELPSYVVKYVTAVSALRKRLDFFGFSLDVSKRAFEIGKEREIESIQRQMKLWQSLGESEARVLIPHYERELGTGFKC